MIQFALKNQRRRAVDIDAATEDADFVVHGVVASSLPEVCGVDCTAGNADLLFREKGWHGEFDDQKHR
jgi:hypothetical protein